MSAQYMARLSPRNKVSTSQKCPSSFMSSVYRNLNLWSYLSWLIELYILQSQQTSSYDKGGLKTQKYHSPQNKACSSLISIVLFRQFWICVSSHVPMPFHHMSSKDEWTDNLRHNVPDGRYLDNGSNAQTKTKVI